MAAIVCGPIGRKSVAAANVVAASAERPDTLTDVIGAVVAGGQQHQASGQTPPPAPPAPPDPPRPPAAPQTGSTHIQQSESGSSGTFSWSRNGEKISAEYRGSFTVNDSDTDIARMSPDARLKISDGGWAGGRSVEFIADGSGNITRRFRVGSSERPFEPEGREWLAKMLPRIVRATAFGAKERVARFLSKGGVQAVLGEISQIDTDYAKKVYFTQLIEQARFDPASARQMLEQAGREIDSDYDLASTLIAAAQKLLVDNGTRKAYFDAARTLESDYEMRRALTAALEQGPVAPELLADVLDAARSLDSDYEAATLLLQVIDDRGVEGPVRAPFFSALRTVESSYEKSRVLQALLRSDRISQETLAAAIDAASTGSDYETAQVLVTAARSHTITGAIRDAYVRAAERLGDYERDRALEALARANR
jgi:hypothetical protein